MALQLVDPIGYPKAHHSRGRLQRELAQTLRPLLRQFDATA
jgi:hypothetical protein